MATFIGASLSEPHIRKREIRAVSLSVCRSVCMFMTRKYTRVYSTNLRVPSVVDCSVYSRFGALLCTPTFNKHVVTNNINKQVLILRSKFIDR